MYDIIPKSSGRELRQVGGGGGSNAGVWWWWWWC